MHPAGSHKEVRFSRASQASQASPGFTGFTCYTANRQLTTPPTHERTNAAPRPPDHQARLPREQPCLSHRSIHPMPRARPAPILVGLPCLCCWGFGRVIMVKWHQLYVLVQLGKPLPQSRPYHHTAHTTISPYLSLYSSIEREYVCRTFFTIQTR